MNSGIVDSTSISSRPLVPNSLLIAPSKPTVKPRAEKNVPSAAPPSMIVNSGAPLMNTSASRTIRRVCISVPAPHLLRRRLPAKDVVDVDHHVQQRVEDDQEAADRDQPRDAHAGDQLVLGRELLLVR